MTISVTVTVDSSLQVVEDPRHAIITKHASKHMQIPHDATKPTPIVDSSARITGTITLTAAPGAKYKGVSVAVTQAAGCLPYVQEAGLMLSVRPPKTVTSTVCDAGVVGASGTVRLPFTLDLSDGDFDETFVGRISAVRHALRITVRRPLPYFNAKAVTPLIVQCIGTEPDAIAAEPLPLTVMAGGGSITFEYNGSGDLLEASGDITGTLRVKGITDACGIQAVELAIIMTERTPLRSATTAVLTHTPIGAGTIGPDALGVPVVAPAEDPATHIAPAGVTGTHTFPVRIRLSRTTLHPEFSVPLGAPGSGRGTIDVFYGLRLVVFSGPSGATRSDTVAPLRLRRDMPATGAAAAPTARSTAMCTAEAVTDPAVAKKEHAKELQLAQEKALATAAALRAVSAKALCA